MAGERLFFCRQVDSLDKRQCNLDAIPPEVERYARSLEELLLDSNHIKILSKVSVENYSGDHRLQHIFRLHKLHVLRMSDNEIARVPPEIKELQNLIELDLSKNGGSRSWV